MMWRRVHRIRGVLSVFDVEGVLGFPCYPYPDFFEGEGRVARLPRFARE